MKIDQLKLKNIGCFTDKTFNFSNLNIIFGENRTGKSTLVYALYFAIFSKHLNKNLSLKDLCQKGHKSGMASLFFSQNKISYKLDQSTNQMPKIYTKSKNNEIWQSLTANTYDDLKLYIPIDAEIASLGSFFRESELIYFLQDIPRYNKTLLQSLIGMDEALIIRSRFKKALTKSREVKKAVLNAAPKRNFDALNIELAKRKIIEAETKLAKVESEYKKILAANPSHDPTVFRLLQKQFNEKQKQHDALLKIKENMKQKHELENALHKLENELKSNKEDWELKEHITPYLQQKKYLSSQDIRYMEKAKLCPLCRQAVLPEYLSNLMVKKNDKLNNYEKQQQLSQKEIEQIKQQLNQLKNIDMQLKELTDQLTSLKSDLNQFSLLKNDLNNLESLYAQKKNLEDKQKFLQKEIIYHKVTIKQYENIDKRMLENKKNLQKAQKDVLICKTAYQALDDAMQLMGTRLLDHVRDSIQVWMEHFSFLNQFDIQISDRELLPIIQAKGYQYKLNQMSKSERIFLYLLLKLAIGDALGHPGIFVLDDPADGLDMKRKQTLAYLLAEVAQKRQMIITTNDLAFAELFSNSSRINL